jgi:hypothetical protein
MLLWTCKSTMLVDTQGSTIWDAQSRDVARGHQGKRPRQVECIFIQCAVQALWAVCRKAQNSSCVETEPRLVGARLLAWELHNNYVRPQQQVNQDDPTISNIHRTFGVFRLGISKLQLRPRSHSKARRATLHPFFRSDKMVD